MVWWQEGERGLLEEEGEDVVLHRGPGAVPRTEEDGEADDEFEALLSKTMSESVEKSKLARATTQVMTWENNKRMSWAYDFINP